MIDIKGKNVFISGPMTGVPLLNAPEFAKAHMWLIEHGAKDVYDPVEEFNSRHGQEEVQPHEVYMRRCLRELTMVDEFNDETFYDILVQLDGWQDSDGANTEYIVARACGIDVVEMRYLVGEDDGK